MAVAAIGAVVALASLAYGAYQTEDAKKNLAKMGSRPQPTITAEQMASKARADEMAKRGYTATETANFQQGLARSQNTAYRHAMDTSGGGLAGAIRAALSYSNINAQNQFAAQDAGLHRQNIRYADQRGDVVSGQKNLITGSEQHTYDQLATAYGNEGQAGARNMYNGLSMGLGAAAAADAGKTGGTGGTGSPYYDPNARISPYGGYGTPQVKAPQNPMVLNNDLSGGFNFASDYYNIKSKNPPYGQSSY